IEEECERRTGAVAQGVDGAGQRILPEPLPTHGTEPSNALPEIAGLGCQHYATLRGELEHERTSSKARTHDASGQVDSALWRHSRVPSARDSSSCPAPVGGGAICFFRSVRRNRNCLATRAGGHTAA